MPTSTSESSAQRSPWRSVLFVSALQMDGLDDAFASGADAVCIDLEDAVPPGLKEETRADALSRLQARAPTDASLIVRVNSLRSATGVADVIALLRTRTPVTTLLFPKLESEEELLFAEAWASDANSPMRFCGIVETPAGLEACASFRSNHPRLDALFFGGYDLSTALGAELAWEPLLYGRSRVVHAAANACVQVLDSPFPDLNDDAGLAEACRRVRALGMTGKVTKQASQIASINASFTASAGEIAHARRVVAAFEADPTKPLYVDGRLIELPSIKRLARLAAGAGRT
jgi:(S)-citramalyl-CoA lyase